MIFLIVLQENRAAEWRESGISIDLIARLLGHKKATLWNKDISHLRFYTLDMSRYIVSVC